MKHPFCLSNYRTRLTTSSAFLSFATISQAQFDSSEEIIELAPHIVSGETYAFGAQKVINIQSDDLDRQIALDLSDIFSQDPSIKVGGGFGPAQKIYVRGIEDKMLSISIDGATQGGYLSHHHGQYSIEPELLKFIEAEPGAGGAVVGPGALAGSISIQTKSASDFLRNDQQFGAFSKATYAGNADQWKLTVAGFGEVNENLQVLAAYTYGESGDYENGNGNLVPYTGSQKARTFVRLDGSIDAQHTYGFSHEETYEKGTFLHRPNFAEEFDHPVAPNKPVYMDIGRHTTIFDYGFRPEAVNFDGNAKISLSDFVIDRPSQYEMGYKSFGVDLDARSSFEQHTLRYGVDFRDDVASFTGKGSTEGFARPLVYSTIPDETITILGFYVQDSWQLNPKTQVSGGARFDSYDYTDKDAKKYKSSGFSPNIGVSYEITRDLDVNVSFGQAFRGVTPIDLITANEGGVSNADEIDGETSQNAELGFQYDNGTFFANGTLYRQKINDVIVSNGVRDNSGNLEVTGYDFALGARIQHLTASLGASHSEPERNGQTVIDAANGIGVGSGRSWSANVDYLVTEYDLSFGWSLKFVESFEKGDEPLAYKESYSIHDLYIRWIYGDTQTMVLTLAISNVFDAFYVDQATSGYNSQLDRVAGLPEAGRSIKLSASYQF